MQYLLKALVLPLFIITVAAMVGSVFVNEPWSGLLVNLAASFIGSIITVFYIDTVIKRHERDQWTAVKSKVQGIVERVANVGVNCIRSALKVGPDVYDNSLCGANDSNRRRRTTTELADVILPPLLARARSLDETAWKSLVINLQTVSVQADRAVGLFGSRIGAQVMDAVLELQETTEGIVNTYFTFPDIFGLPADRLQPKRDGSSSVPTQEDLYDYVVQQLGKLLSQCANLLRCLDCVD